MSDEIKNPCKELWYENRIERDLHRVQMVLLITLACLVGLTATIVLEIM